ncbi:MAG: hypothetical protein VKO21_06920 [Candidatus Sericytochromatia bacterium]|nr:hypothetical protein [Candidatus Sericytochromatia bacterium]
MSNPDATGLDSRGWRMTLLAGPHVLWWILLGLFGITATVLGPRAMGLRLLALAVLGSTAWLLIAPLLPRWRQHVNEKLAHETLAREHQARETRRATLRADLPAILLKQARAFSARIAELRDTMTIQGQRARELLGTELSRLESLEDAHLELLSLLHRQRLHLGQNDPQRIGREIIQVRKDLSSAGSTAHREALEENLVILDKRHERLLRLEDEVQVLGARIQILEDALDLAYEQILAMQADPSRPHDLEALFSGLTVAERTLVEMRALEHALESTPELETPENRPRENEQP